MENRALEIIRDHIADNAAEIAQRYLDTDESVTLYIFYSAPTEEYDDEWYVEYTDRLPAADAELIEVYEEAEAADEVQEILDDWAAYRRNPYAYYGLCEADFH